MANNAQLVQWWLPAWSFWACPLYLYGDDFPYRRDESAWVLGENPKPFLEGQRHNGGVTATVTALQLFFSLLYISTLYTRTVHEYCRSSWHSGWWSAKIILLLGCYMAPIMLPDYFLQLYGKAAPFGAGLFLIIQLISVISRRRVNTISKLAYGCSMVGIILMTFWYIGCYFNAALIVTTLLLVYIMPIISLLSKAKGFYMEPMLMGVYIVFLCWSAIKSEPGTSCYKKESTGSAVNWITMISFIAVLASVTVSAFSTGTDYKCLQFTNVAESENDVPYGYGFFHLVFATGSMYFGMLFLGWDTHHALGKYSMDVGWTSTIVHVVNEGLAVIFFVMVILARFYGIDWLQQLLGKIFGIGGQQLADESSAAEPPELEGIEMGGNIGSPQESRANRAPQQGSSSDTEPMGIERDSAEPSSSSSMTGLSHHTTSVPQVRRLGKTYGEIDEEW